MKLDRNSQNHFSVGESHGGVGRQVIMRNLMESSCSWFRSKLRASAAFQWIILSEGNFFSCLGYVHVYRNYCGESDLLGKLLVCVCVCVFLRSGPSFVNITRSTWATGTTRAARKSGRIWTSRTKGMPAFNLLAYHGYVSPAHTTLY